MKRIALALLATMLFFTALATVYTPKSVPNVHVADREQFIADPDNLIAQAERDSINAVLKSLRQSTTVEAMIAVVGEIDPAYDENQFVTELFEQWGLGKSDKDNGLLIFAAMDLRRVVIRTGRGIEGVLPDAVCARIIRKVIVPAMRQGQPGQALLGAATVVGQILTDPDAADEIISAQRDTDQDGGGDDISGFQFYMAMAASLAFLMLACLLIRLWTLAGSSDHKKYNAMITWRDPMLIFTFLGVGLPCVATIPLLLMLNHWRNHPRRCPNCKAKMHRLDEESDNAYLTPAQDLEEQIGSVDYDVWLCPQCNETDILPYQNHNDRKHIECDVCHARTAHLVKARVLLRPTSTQKGRGVRVYECRNCHATFEKPYDIDPTGGDAGSAMLAGAVIGSALGGHGRSGGGSIGGGFGGGFTSGGGASGGW